MTYRKFLENLKSMNKETTFDIAFEDGSCITIEKWELLLKDVLDKEMVGCKVALSFS